MLLLRSQCALPQLVTDDWERAVETLYLSLKQHNVCVLKVSEIMAKGNQISKAAELGQLMCTAPALTACIVAAGD